MYSSLYKHTHKHKSVQIRHDLIEHITDQSNLYLDPSKPANITNTEAWKYIDICLISTVMNCKNLIIGIHQ